MSIFLYQVYVVVGICYVLDSFNSSFSSFVLRVPGIVVRSICFLLTSGHFALMFRHNENEIPTGVLTSIPCEHVSQAVGSRLSIIITYLHLVWSRTRVHVYRYGFSINYFPVLELVVLGQYLE